MTTDIITGAVDRQADSFGLIEPDMITPNPWQPRRTIDEESLSDLAQDIERNGLLQPILVRPIQHGRRYELVFGQRRLLAVQWLIVRDRWFGGIQAQIRELDDRAMFMAAIAENRERESVDPVEEAEAGARAIDEIEGLTQQDLADAWGVSASQVSNRLRILGLPEAVLDLVKSDTLGWTAARELLALVARDHRHDQEIAEVLEVLDSWNGQRTGHTVQNVRRAVVEVCARQSRRWRPLVGVGGFAGRAAATPPAFDVELFQDEHPDRLHTLPRRMEHSGGDLWTCEGKAWLVAQRAAQQEQGIDDASDPARDAWADAMSKDTVVLRTVSDFSREKAVLTPEQEERLGTRARMVKSTSGLRFAVPLNPSQGGAPPRYFPRKECQTSCTKGAFYAPSYVGDRPTLHCSNETCFKTKLHQGKEVYRAALTRTIAEDDVRQANLAERLRVVLGATPELARRLGQVLVGAVSAAPERPVNSSLTYQDSDLIYYPAAKRRAAEALGFKVDAESTALLWTRDNAAKVLAAHPHPVAVTSELMAVVLDEVGLSLDDLSMSSAPVSSGCEHEWARLYENRMVVQGHRKVSRKVAVGNRCQFCGESSYFLAPAQA